MSPHTQGGSWFLFPCKAQLRKEHDLFVQEMSDQDVTNRYAIEMLKLKTLNQFGRYSERFLGYPNTLIMNRCRQELERRSLPIPSVNPADQQEHHAAPCETAPDESNDSARKDGNV
jgi:hypothetical protein